MTDASQKTPPLLERLQRFGTSGATTGEIMDAIKRRDRLIGAATRLSDCVAEFDGDLSFCGERLDELWHAVDRYKAEETNAD